MPTPALTKPKIVLTIILKSRASLIQPFATRHGAQEFIDGYYQQQLIRKAEWQRLTRFLASPDEPAHD